MKKIFFIVCFLLVNSKFYAQVNTNFPILTGKTLTDKTVTIPTDTKGKYTVLCITYSQKSSDVLAPWFQPMYSTFLDASEYNINLFFIGMISGAKELAAGTIEKKMKQKVDPSLQPYTLLYNGGIGDYKQALKMPEKDQPYFYVLDENGKIVYTTSGAYTDAKLEGIEGAIK